MVMNPMLQSRKKNHPPRKTNPRDTCEILAAWKFGSHQLVVGVFGGFQHTETVVWKILVAFP